MKLTSYYYSLKLDAVFVGHAHFFLFP